jgi:ribosomal protein L37AE/L43A
MQTTRPSKDHPWQMRERLCKHCGTRLLGRKARRIYTCDPCRHKYYQPHGVVFRRPTMEQEFLFELEKRR